MLTFKIAGCEVSFTDANGRYFSIRQAFMKYADEMARDVRSLYSRKSRELGMGYKEYIIGLAQGAAKKAAEFGMVYLSKAECYEFSIDEIVNHINIDRYIEDDLEKISQIIHSRIHEGDERVNEEEEKVLVADDGWPVFWARVNAAAAKRQEISNINKFIADILSDKSFVSIVGFDIHCIVVKAHTVICQMLNRHFGDDYCKMLPSGAYDAARSLVQQIDSGLVGDSKVPETYARALNLDPFWGELYRRILLKFGDRTGHLRRMAELFEINGYNKVQMEALYLACDKLKLCEDGCDVPLLQQSVSETARDVGRNPALEFPPLCRKLKDEDFRLRTCNGKCYATVDEAERVRILINAFKQKDFSTQTAFDQSKAELENLADELRVDIGLISPKLSVKAAELRNSQLNELKKCYDRLDLSDEDKAMAARQVIPTFQEKRENSGISGVFSLFG